MNQTWPKALLMFLWLMLGYAVIHTVVFFWGLLIIESNWRRPTISRSLQISENGEPFVWIQTGNYKTQYRHLDGSPLPEKFNTRDLATSANLPASNPGEDEADEADFWAFRIASFSDGLDPTGFWYLVAPPSYSGAAFFMGYDELSKRLIGYIGLNGLSSLPPTREQSFLLHNSGYSVFHGSVVSPSKAYFTRNEAYEPQNSRTILDELARNSKISPDTVWIRSHNKILEVHLRDQTVKTLLENQGDLRSLTSLVFNSETKISVKLIVRTPETILVVEPESGKKTVLSVKPPTPGNAELLHGLKNGKFLLTTWKADTTQENLMHYDLTWLDAEGKVERQTTADLDASNHSSMQPGYAIAICPSPIIAFGTWINWGVNFLGMPVPHDSTMQKRFASFFKLLWDWLLFSPLIGLATAYAARRRETQVFHNSNWFWPLLVGLTGWFGWIGYITLRPLPARTPQGNFLPSRPEPNTLKGTEIFA